MPKKTVIGIIFSLTILFFIIYSIQFRKDSITPTEDLEALPQKLVSNNTYYGELVPPSKIVIEVDMKQWQTDSNGDFKYPPGWSVKPLVYSSIQGTNTVGYQVVPPYDKSIEQNFYSGEFYPNAIFVGGHQFDCSSAGSSVTKCMETGGNDIYTMSKDSAVLVVFDIFVQQFSRYPFAQKNNN